MDISEISVAEQAARIRAAIGYSRQEQKAVAKALGKSAATLGRRIARKNPTGASSMDELYKIASICGVPPIFMEQGFASLTSISLAEDEPNHEERLVALEREIRAIRQSLPQPEGPLQPDWKADTTTEQTQPPLESSG